MFETERARGQTELGTHTWRNVPATLPGFGTKSAVGLTWTW
jgi:hypothetical protein